MRVVTAREMRDIDELAIRKFKVPSIVLMENAGLRAAEIVARKHDELGYNSEILVFAGKGKNGGDAFVVARQLVAMGKAKSGGLSNATPGIGTPSHIIAEIFSARTGMPITRPLWLAYPRLRGAQQIDDEYLLGPDVLVVPVVTEGATTQRVVFPPGCWRDPATGRRYDGVRTATVAAPLDRAVYFVACGRTPFVAPSA